MAYNATTWTEKSNPSWHTRFGLVSAAAMPDLHVIQGPNVTRDAREKIALFAFHAFVVEDSRFQQNRVRTKLYNCGACVCKSNVEIRIAGSFYRPQQIFFYKFPFWFHIWWWNIYSGRRNPYSRFTSVFESIEWMLRGHEFFLQLKPNDSIKS